MTHCEALEGKWRGKCRMQSVASTLHTASEHAVSSITTADVHTSAARSWLNWRLQADLNVLVRLAAKTKSGLCACAITFQKQSTACRWLGVEARQSAQVQCCLQAVSSMCVGTFRPLSWRHNFLLNVKRTGVFTQWQTQRHISRDSHCHFASGVPRGIWGLQTSSEIPKAHENHVKLNSTCENCYKLLNLWLQHTKMYGKNAVKI